MIPSHCPTVCTCRNGSIRAKRLWCYGRISARNPAGRRGVVRPRCVRRAGCRGVSPRQASRGHLTEVHGYGHELVRRRRSGQRCPAQLVAVGGQGNDACGGVDNILGGLDNGIDWSSDDVTISGGANNVVTTANFSTIGGGDGNILTPKPARLPAARQKSRPRGHNWWRI